MAEASDNPFKDLSQKAQEYAAEMEKALAGNTDAVNKFKEAIKKAGKDASKLPEIFENASKKIQSITIKAGMLDGFSIDLAKYGDEVLNIANEYSNITNQIAANEKARVDATADLAKAQADVKAAAGGTVKAQEDAAKALADAQRKMARMDEDHVLLNKRSGELRQRYVSIGGSLAHIDELQGAILKGGVDHKKTLEGQLDVLREQAEEYTKQKEAAEKLLKGDIGGLLGTDKVKEGIMKTVGAVLTGKVKIKEALRSIGGMLTSKKALIGFGIAGALTLAGWAAYAFWNRTKEVDKKMEDLRKNTGMTVAQTQKLKTEAREISKEFAHLGVNMENTLDTVSAVTKEMGTTRVVSKETIAAMALLGQNFGVTADNSAKTLKNFTGLAGASEESAVNVMRMGAHLSEKAGIPTKIVFEDIASASSETLMSLSKTPMEMMKVALEARRLGTSMDSITKSGRGLLNFQESVQNEMAASALLGRSINVQNIRRMVYEKDFIGARKESLRQIKSLGDFNKMTYQQQQAITRLYGIEYDELNKMLATEKILDAMRKDPSKKNDLKYYEASLRRQNLEKDKELEKQVKADIQAGKRQGQISRITNAIEKLKNRAGDAMDFIGDGILSIGVGLTKVIGGTEDAAEKAEKATKAQRDAAKEQKTTAEKIEDTTEGLTDAVLRQQAAQQRAVDGGLKLVSGGRKLYDLLYSKIKTPPPPPPPAVPKFKLTTMDALRSREAASAAAASASAAGKTAETGAKALSWMDRIKNALRTLGGGFSKYIEPISNSWKSLTAAFTSTSMGRVASTLSGLFGAVIKGLVGVAKKILFPIFIIKDTWKKFTDIFQTDGKWDFSDWVMKGLKLLAEMPMIIYNNTIGWIGDLADMIVGFFGGPKGMIRDIVNMVPEGLKLVGEYIGDYLVWLGADYIPIIWDDMIDGLVEAVKRIPQIIGNAFDSAKEKIKGWLGFSPSEIGLSIVKGISSVGDKIIDFLTSPFKKAWDWIKDNVPFAKTLFGGGSAETTVKVSGGELNESLNKLNEAVSRLNQAPVTPAPIVNVSDNTAAMVAKLDELITLLQEGAIGVNMDGIKVSKILAKTA